MGHRERSQLGNSSPCVLWKALIYPGQATGRMSPAVREVGMFGSNRGFALVGLFARSGFHVRWIHLCSDAQFRGGIDSKLCSVPWADEVQTPESDLAPERKDGVGGCWGWRGHILPH